LMRDPTRVSTETEHLMAIPRTKLRPAVLAVASAAFGLALVGGPLSDAHADGVQIGKGVTGGALLGADAVTIVESLVGVHAGWAYGVGALAGAAGGGVGGYFLSNDANNDGKVPTYLLAGGLALVIPALVLYFNATRYMPEEGATEDRSPTAPAAEPGVPGGSVTGAPPDVASPPPPQPPAASPPPVVTPQAKARVPRMPRVPTSPALSLVDVEEGALRLGLPVPDIRPVYSVADQRQYGMQGETELRLPFLHVTF
jgi:hypothetical protein